MGSFELYQKRLRDSRKISKERLIDTKVKTFKKALDSSYNSQEVVVEENSFKALITGIPTSPKISKRNFATLLENGCEVGDQVYWTFDDSHWLITEHDSTEISVFQGSMEKALYILKWVDPKSGKIYSTRACAKGPDETTISEGVKHSIFFDLLTDSLFLIVPTKVEGVELLQRYFELMIDGKKWRIEVIDESTSEDLIFLQLIETTIDREADSEEFAGGKLPNKFTIDFPLEGLEEIAKGQSVELAYKLYRNGYALETEQPEINVKNCTLLDNSVTFDSIGLSSVELFFPDYGQKFKWEIEVVENSEDPLSITQIIGSSSVRALTYEDYTFAKVVNGSFEDVGGSFEFDEEYFGRESSGAQSIRLKVKNKTGETKIKFVSTDNKVLHEKEIIVKTRFTRS